MGALVVVTLLANLSVARGVRFAETPDESDKSTSEKSSSSKNPIAKLDFTSSEQKFYHDILESVPLRLIKAVAARKKCKTCNDDASEAKCWSVEDHKVTKDNQIYDDKVNTGLCDKKEGVNSNDEVTHASLARMRSVAHLFGVGENDTILDYGAGCGHQADEIARLRGCKFYAVDQSQAAQKWAKDNLENLEDFCVGDQESMKFDKSTFDFVFSSGAVGHMDVEAQCKLIGETFLNFLKPGGCAWFGGLGCTTEKPYKWQEVPEQTFLKEDCIKSEGVKGPWILNDNYLFGTSVFPQTGKANMTYRENSYSVFLCKPTGEEEGDKTTATAAATMLNDVVE